MKVHEALIEVMRAVPAVRKEDRNAQQNFNFRGIDATLNAVGPALRRHGVLVRPQVMEWKHEEAVTTKGTKMRSVLLVVRYTFVGPEGDELLVEVPGEAMDAGDKAYSKAMSVAFRTALLQMLALPTDEKDPDHEVHERATEPVRTGVDVARDALLKYVERHELNRTDVARLYLADRGHPIGEETEAAAVYKFIDQLKVNEGS